MARPLRVTPEMKASLLKEFAQYLNTSKLADGCVSFNRRYTYKEGESAKVRLHFEPGAYLKMTSLIDGFTVDEVAWYGTVERPEPDLFVITDIITYPQTVGAAAVNTDQETENSEYTKWMIEVEPEIWNKLRFQGHSHVKMGVTPSQTDLNHQAGLIAQFNNPDDFYIFMIWNQRLEYDVKIYDSATNTLYENKDVILTTCDPNLDLDAFMAEAKKMVKVVQPATGYSSGYNYGGKTYGTGGYQYGGQYSGYGYDDDDDFYGSGSNHAGGGWHRGVYGDGKKQAQLPAAKSNKASDAAQKGKIAEKKEEGAAGEGKAGGAGKVVNFNQPS